MDNIRGMLGYKIGCIEVIGLGYHRKNEHRMFECKCNNCGNIFYQTKSNLLNRLKGKGCKNCNGSWAKTHGMKFSKIYNVWKQMKHRCKCTERDMPHWKDYAGRGITICKEWENFENFYKWAIENGYNDTDLYISGRNKMTIDRIDNDKGYCPENCRFITHKENQQNKRTTVKINYQGKEYSLSQLAEYLDINYDLLRQRLKLGWSIEKCINKKGRGYNV